MNPLIGLGLGLGVVPDIASRSATNPPESDLSFELTWYSSDDRDCSNSCSHGKKCIQVHILPRRPLRGIVVRCRAAGNTAGVRTATGSVYGVPSRGRNRRGSITDSSSSSWTHLVPPSRSQRAMLVQEQLQQLPKHHIIIMMPHHYDNFLYWQRGAALASTHGTKTWNLCVRSCKAAKSLASTA